MHAGPFSRVARPLTPPMRAEVAALAGRYGAPITRDVALDDIAFDPVGNPSRFAEVCMVVRRPTGEVLLSIKTFYPRGAYRLPTGGIDKDEPILDAVLRETLEETGLTVDVRSLADQGAWWIGLVLAVLLAFLIRPLLVGLVLWPVRLARNERLFVLWAGLKGAVPVAAL